MIRFVFAVVAIRVQLPSRRAVGGWCAGCSARLHYVRRVLAIDL
jgi:hypothetical protein